MTFLIWSTFLVTALVYWTLLMVWALVIMGERARGEREIARAIATQGDKRRFEVGLRVRGGRILLLLLLPPLLLTVGRAWWAS
jgi:hypothetical protein